jgi:hypothetical protein
VRRWSTRSPRANLDRRDARRDGQLADAIGRLGATLADGSLVRFAAAAECLGWDTYGFATIRLGGPEDFSAVQYAVYSPDGEFQRVCACGVYDLLECCGL